jgi:hypothetical protein
MKSLYKRKNTKDYQYGQFRSNVFVSLSMELHFSFRVAPFRAKAKRVGSCFVGHCTCWIRCFGGSACFLRAVFGVFLALRMGLRSASHKAHPASFKKENVLRPAHRIVVGKTSPAPSVGLCRKIRF